MHKKSQCLNCIHFIDNGKWGCKAFYTIPDNIFFNKEIHNNIIKGQTGEYIYTVKKGETKIAGDD